MFSLLLSVALTPVFGIQQHQHQHPPQQPAKPPVQQPNQHPAEQHEGHMPGTHSMRGVLGDWPMGMEGGGTTWLPKISPHYATPVGPWGRYDAHLMGTLTVGFVDAGGRRGDEEVFVNSMAMLHTRRETGPGVLSLRAMMSLDPVFNGEEGVPNLFQTGETADGEPLVDRQHPHDLIAELAASYSWPVGGDRRMFLYVGLPGEPALGNSMFMHRPSGMEIPEAPISHHWFDSTHISFGVVTAGMTWGERWKLDASVFNGREPDEDRYDIETGKLDSASVRITHNPTPDLSLSASYGFLSEPEELEPGEDQHRLTASAVHVKPLPGRRALATGLYFGRNMTHHGDTDAWNLEASLLGPRDAWFLRLEQVEKDEIIDVPEGTYDITKLVLGYTRNLSSHNGFDLGVGAYAGFYDFPSELEPFYGDNPVTLGIYLRLRPARMH